MPSPHRRSFLKAAAASATLPALLVRGAGAQPASNKITVGIIGVGVQARGHLGALLNNPGVEVVAVSDVVKERLDAAVQSADQKYAARVKAGERIQIKLKQGRLGARVEDTWPDSQS